MVSAICLDVSRGGGEGEDDERNGATARGTRNEEKGSWHWYQASLDSEELRGTSPVDCISRNYPDPTIQASRRTTCSMSIHDGSRVTIPNQNDIGSIYFRHVPTVLNNI